MLEIDHISKNYQRKGERQPFQALAPCTATIGDGEFVSIVGPVSYTHLTLPTTPYV